MATNLSPNAPAAAASGGFLRWWLDELAAAAPRRRARAAAPRHRGFLLRPIGGGNGGGSETVEVLRPDRRRGPRPLGLLTLPPAPPPSAAPGATAATAAGPVELPPEQRRLAGLLRRRRAAGRDPVVLMVGEGRSLLCVDVLPAGAEADLDRIMPHRVELLTPWPPERVLAGYRVLRRRQDGDVEVLLAAAPRAAVEPTLARLAACGIGVDAVDVAREDGAPAGLDLLGRRDRGRRGPGFPAKLLGVLLVAGVLAAGGLAGREVWRQRGELETRRQFAAALEARVADLPQLRARVDTLRQQAGFVAERQREAPSPLVVMEVLSRILPDSVWLESVALEGRELTVSGYAEDAAEVVPTVESSAHFSGVEFRAPSTRVSVPGPGGGNREVERFSLGATVEPLGEPEP